MTDEVQSSLQKLRQTIPKLNKMSDEAAAIVQRVETLLRDEWSVGIHGYTLYERSVDTIEDGDVSVSGEVLKALVFTRIEGTFRIGVCIDEYRGEDGAGGLISSVTVPWDQCDRSTKLASFAQLPQLLASMASKAERACQEVKVASKTMEQLLTAFSAEK